MAGSLSLRTAFMTSGSAFIAGAGSSNPLTCTPDYVQLPRPTDLRVASAQCGHAGNCTHTASMNMVILSSRAPQEGPRPGRSATTTSHQTLAFIVCCIPIRASPSRCGARISEHWQAALGAQRAFCCGPRRSTLRGREFCLLSVAGQESTRTADFVLQHCGFRFLQRSRSAARWSWIRDRVASLGCRR
jgi:hypothetical protein